MYSFDRIILSLFAILFAVGAMDYLSGNRMGLGKRFYEGLQTFAPLMLAMAGFIVLTDVLAKLLAPVLTPVFTFVGSDPGLFPGIFLACDNGAYPLAQKLSSTPEAGGFGGMLLSSVLGVNICCIPFVTQLVEKKDRNIFFKGLACGIITIPAGLIAGGLAASYPFSFILKQLPLLVVLSILFAVMLKYVPDILTGVLGIFAKGMEIICISAFSLAVFAELSGMKIAGLLSVMEPVKIVGGICLVLPGVYVFTELLMRILKKPFSRIAGLLSINECAVTGFITTAANAIPTLVMFKNMDSKGKLLNSAFLTSVAYMLGDHLAFCGSAAPELLLPLLVTKFTAGICAFLLALFSWKMSWIKDG